jgi:hypothetical protein
MPAIVPISGRLSFFKVGAVSYQFTRWSFKLTLDRGKVMHFDSTQDGAGHYIPTKFHNFLDGEGSVGGAVDHATNVQAVTLAGGVYPGNQGQVYCLWSATNGWTFPGKFFDLEMKTDAGGTDPGGIDLAFEITGAPDRIY